MVGVAQQVELLVVVQAVAGSSPVAHPKKALQTRGFLRPPRMRPTHRGTNLVPIFQAPSTSQPCRPGASSVRLP